TRTLRNSEFVLQARACGCRGWRLLLRQVLPNLKPVLYAQFWVSIPIFLLSEANLGILGLGVAEPLPSWGNLLRGLENYSAVLNNPWRVAPLGLLIIVVSCFQLILPLEDFRSCGAFGLHSSSLLFLLFLPPPRLPSRAGTFRSA